MKTYVCLQCNFWTRVAAKLTRHEKTQHGVRLKFECPSCSHTTNLKSNLRQHIKAVHEKIRAQCPHCQFSSAYSQDLAKHVMVKHRELEAMANNGDSSEMAKAEMLVQEEPVDLCCRQCKKNNTEENIMQHVNIANGDSKPFSCIHCKYSTVQKNDVVEHVKAIHYRIKNRKCPYCNFGTSWKPSLRYHIKAVHPHPDEQPVKNAGMHKDNRITWDINCKECSKSNSQENILQHVRIVVDDEKPFHCLHCSFSNTTKHPLVQHVKLVHYNIMPEKLKCPHCSHSTDRNSSLKKHMQAYHKHLAQESKATGQNIQPEMGASSTLQKTVTRDIPVTITAHSWEGSGAADMNQALTFYREVLDIADLTQDDDEKKLVILKQYKCSWCSSNSDPNNFTLEEMESHLQENHCLTLKEYLDMNEISFS